MSGPDREVDDRVSERPGDRGPDPSEPRDPVRRPETADEPNYLPGAAALVLFAVFAVAFAQASFGSPAGFPNGANVTASIGYAMFNLFDVDAGATLVSSEGFLAMFEMMALVLTAALVGAVVLGRREDETANATGAIADGGRRIRRAIDRSGGED